MTIAVRLVLILSLAWPAGRDTASPPTPLQVAGHGNAHVSLAADGDLVIAVWAARQESRSDVYAATSQDGGRTFGAAVRVNPQAGEVQAGGERPPRVAIATRRGVRTVAVLWGAAPPAPDHGPVIRLAESIDDGRTFRAPVALSAAGARGIRSWASLDAGDDGTWHAAWLDGRMAAASRPPAGTRAPHQHGTAAQTTRQTGSTRATRGARQDLYHARVDPDGRVHERLVTEDVCFCCKTATLAGRAADVRIAYRHIFSGGERDIALSAGTATGDRFAPPVRISLDHWRIDACPDDGPALAADGAGTIHVVWPTLVDAAGTAKGVFHTRVAGGTPFAARVRLDTGTATPSHPQIAAQRDGAALAAWDEVDTAGRRILVARIGPQVPAPRTLGPGSYPAVAAVTGGFVVAWTEGSGDASVIRVARLAADASVAGRARAGAGR